MGFVSNKELGLLMTLARQVRSKKRKNNNKNSDEQ